MYNRIMEALDGLFNQQAFLLCKLDRVERLPPQSNWNDCSFSKTQRICSLSLLLGWNLSEVLIYNLLVRSPKSSSSLSQDQQINGSLVTSCPLPDFVWPTSKNGFYRWKFAMCLVMGNINFVGESLPSEILSCPKKSILLIGRPMLQKKKKTCLPQFEFNQKFVEICFLFCYENTFIISSLLPLGLQGMWVNIYYKINVYWGIWVA